jgi:hypothetical protein
MKEMRLRAERIAAELLITQARGLLKKEGIPFTRPGDYFAEMVKNDEHMNLIQFTVQIVMDVFDLDGLFRN